jgi:FkbM family methyltransferase
MKLLKIKQLKGVIMSRKIFIDGGAWNGTSIDMFRKQWKDHKEYEIYSFECNPQFWWEIKKRDVNFIENAVWIENTELDFYIGRQYGGMGSSVIKEKQTGELDKEHPIKVKAIDFSQWIIDNFSKDDYIVLKLDIEGAEYKVLDKMIDDKSIEYINRLFGEWHQNKIGMLKEDHNKLIDRLNKFGFDDMEAWRH